MSSDHEDNLFDSTCTLFEGFTNIDFSHVPSDVWEVIPRQNSCTIQVHEDTPFICLESQICTLYGSPQRSKNNGNIYRGQIPTLDGCTTNVIITFYEATLLIRVQGAGYAMWVNRVLPSLAKQVMDNQGDTNTISSPPDSSPVTTCTPSRPTNTSSQPDSTPVTMVTTSTPSHPVKSTSNIEFDMIQSLVAATESKAKHETENAMLRIRIDELKSENTQLHMDLTEKECKIQLMCARVTEVDLLQFEYECTQKLVTANELKFDVERQHLLKQIQDLAVPTTSAQTTSATKSYKEALTSSSSKPNMSSTSDSVPNDPSTEIWSTPTKHLASKQVPKKAAPVSTNNKFTVLNDDCDSDSTTQIHDNSNTSRSSLSSSSFNKSSHKRSPRNPKPNVVIFGDSISKRIEGDLLSRNANVQNLSVSGRNIRKVCKDIKDNQSAVSNADSVIIHVGTNNLQKDSLDAICLQFDELCSLLADNVSKNCEVAISSIVPRTDRRHSKSKLNSVNDYLAELSERHNWTLIDNSSVKNIQKDGIHPNDKGMSYIARNYQDFLRCAHPFLFRQAQSRTSKRQPGNRFKNHGQPANLPNWLMHLISQIPQMSHKR